MMDTKTNLGIEIESPVPSLLRNNDAPNVQQTQWIREIILLEESRLETESQHLGTSTARIRHGALACFLHTHRALLSPARRVPYEIWDLIIRFAASDTNLDNMDSIRLIGNVCRIWYAIVKPLRELAGILPLLCFQKHSENHSAHSVYSETVPQRVFSNPPTTDYFGHFPDPITVSNDPRPLVAILSYVSRWKGLSIVLDPNTLWDNANFLGNFLDTSHLTQLRLFFPSKSVHKSAPVRPLSRCDTFNECTSLRKVDLDCDASLSMGLPWDNITSYKERSHGRPTTLERLLLGITSDTNLECLEYRSPFASIFFGTGIVDRIPCPHLRHIDYRIYHESSSVTFPLLEKLRARSIQTLKVRDRSNNFLSQLVDFIAGSKCDASLTVLVIDTRSIIPGELVDLLKSTPMLTTLECNDIPLTDVYLLSMHTGRGKQATLVPFLRNLTVHSSSHLQAIDQMAKDRVRIYRNGSKSSSTGTSESSPFVVKLVFPDHQRTKAAGKALFDTAGSVNNHARSKLSDILSELDIQIDEIKANGMGARSRSLLPSTWSRQSQRLSAIFTYLESLRVETLPEVMNWGIHVLERFSLLHTKSEFLSRAHNLVHSWKDLRQRIAIKPTWILHGRFGLLFIAGVSNPFMSPVPMFEIEEDKDILWGEYNYPSNVTTTEHIAWRRRVNLR